MDQYNFQEQNQEDLKIDLARQYVPYWPLFVLFMILGTGAAYLYLRYTVPIYQVNAKIMVKDEKKGIDESKVLDALDLFAEKKIVENETDIIRSWPLLEQVVKDLKMYAVQKHIGNVKDTELYGSSAPLIITALQPDSIENSEVIPFEIDWSAKQVLIQGQEVKFGGQIKIGDRHFSIDANPLYNAVLEGNKFSLETINALDLAESLQGSLKINPTSKQSTMINVSIETSVPEKGKDFINRLFIVYKNASLADKNQVAENTMNFVDERLELVTKQLDSVERNIEQYKTEKGIVDISTQGQLFLQTMKETDSKMAEVNIQLAVLDDIEKYLEGKGPNPGTVPSVMGINEPTLVSLLTKLYDLEMQYKRLAPITGEQNDQLVQLREQIAQLKPSLHENLRNVRRNLTVSRNRMNGDVSQTGALLKTIPQKEKALLEISRQQGIKNNIYIFLLQKREETALSYAAAVADSRIIESARSTKKPIKPVPLLIYGVAVFIGLGIALLWVAVKEQFNNKVLFRKELEKHTHIPIIGEVAYNTSGEDFVIKEGKRTIIAEQIRAIRGNLSYFGINEEDQKVMLVTSSIPGEGKSFLSTNLAISITLTGKKVVLLELDLRRPKLSRYFNIERDKGITNYIVGKVEMEEIIRHTEFDGLFVIPSGPIPPNPTELLLLPRFSELIKELRNHFDYIIMDSPPIGLVSDAQVLSRFADANIFMVRHDFTPKASLESLRTLYEEKKYKNMCLVFNGVKARGMKIYGKGYSYHYGYGSGTGYGYGNGYYNEELKKNRTIRKKNQGTLS